MKFNTYSLIFGKEPAERISRSSVVTMVFESFSSEPAIQQIFMITGVRDSGKTVLMNEIKSTLQKKQEWIVIELSPERDMLVSLA